ncbi:expressed unknown protein [Seminavis robusta]|uniref:Transmembrane protein n=1 Tax=Seminavis robusta TaxID=568900 RepID=A0A9N8DSW2_9STRA|nr:expressed unknown protein [Seminavis robusta]|eukprot:Sro328_g118750.1 n/a (285) ;mRNA; r:69857-70711
MRCGRQCFRSSSWVVFLFAALLLISADMLEVRAFQPRNPERRTSETANDHSIPAHPTSDDFSRRQALISTASTFMAGLYPMPSTAGLLFSEPPKRQLELCIVSLLRIEYWALKASKDLQSDNPDIRKQRYLEARLASKALVTGKIGGGANYQVFTMNSLQLKDTLRDLVSYASMDLGKEERRRAQDLQTELVESFASVVEFDGLDGTLDGSPRSSLTITMYTENKATFVRRTLTEKVVPTTQALIRLFGPDVEARCVAYVQTTYKDELPVIDQPTPQDSASTAI